jgi:signal transduction histidine kinase
MSFKTILKKLNFMVECRKYGLGFWQCPNSLFLVMGIIIIVAMILTYFIGIHFIEPELVVAIVCIVTVILLIIGHSLVNSFARIAEANRMKSEFVSIVSHQLRTPLSGLKWSLSLLLGKRLGKLNEKQEEYLEIINDSNNRMIKLVNDLLNVSRIEQRRLEMKSKAFSVEDLIERTVRELRLLAESYKVDIKLKIDKNLPKVLADPDKARMVVQNLVDNAIKYSKEKGGLVEIRAELNGKNKKMIRVSVKDNGVGISRFLQKQIFGKFSRGDNLVKQKVEGVGLGLFIAKGIVNLSGGKIDFKSEEGKGTTFWFTLPVAKK